MFKNRAILLRVIGIFITFTLVLAGILILRHSSSMVGIAVTVAGILLFVIAVFLNDKYPIGDVDVKTFRPFMVPVLFWVCSGALMVFVINGLSDEEKSGLVSYLLDLGWLLSLVFLIAGFLWISHWRFPNGEQIKSWFKENKQDIFIISSFVIVAAFLRLYILTKHPFPWSGDECSIGMEASRILKGEVTNFFDGGWSGQPNWSFIPTAISELIFGRTILAIKMVSSVEGTLGVVFVYIFAKELFNKNKIIAFAAAGVMTAIPLHLNFSRIGVNNVIDALNAPLVLWLVLRAVRKGGVLDYLWAGIFGGLTFYTYIGSRLILVLAFLMLAYIAIRRRDFLRSNVANLIVFGIAIVVTIAPQGDYFLLHREIFMTRWSQANIFTNNWVLVSAQNAGMSIPSFLWKHFLDTVLVYISNPAPGNTFNSPLPYLTILGSIFFLFGMGYAFFKILDPNVMTVILLFWAVVFLGGFMTMDAPANTRLVMSLPAVAILIGLGIFKFTDYLLRMKIINPRWQLIISTILVLIYIMQNALFYFGNYYTHDYAEDANAELGQKTGQELQRLGPNYDLYLFGMPRVFAAFPTTVFLAPNNGLFDLTRDKIAGLTLRPGKQDIFVAIPENKVDLNTIEQEFPGGSREFVKRTFKDEVLYYAYLYSPK